MAKILISKQIVSIGNSEKPSFAFKWKEIYNIQMDACLDALAVYNMG